MHGGSTLVNNFKMNEAEYLMKNQWRSRRVLSVEAVGIMV